MDGALPRRFEIDLGERPAARGNLQPAGDGRQRKLVTVLDFVTLLKQGKQKGKVIMKDRPQFQFSQSSDNRQLKIAVLITKPGDFGLVCQMR
jgi:hypothetical protein